MESAGSGQQRGQPWCACLLSGGASRRMGRDKALLAHPEGGTWLERTLALLGGLEMPVTLLSRHTEHLRRAEALAERAGLAIQPAAEPPPWEGPLQALARLMELHPDHRLLLCPVDMPWLNLEALQRLRGAAAPEPRRIHLAHDGHRLQPLLGVYGSGAGTRRDLAATLARGERRLQAWLARQPVEAVPLGSEVLRNVNHPQEWGLPSLRP